MLAAQICHLSSVICYFLPPLYCSFRFHLSVGYSLEPGAVIQVDWDQEEDSFDHVERDIGAGEA